MDWNITASNFIVGLWGSEQLPSMKVNSAYLSLLYFYNCYIETKELNDDMNIQRTNFL